MGEGGSDDTMSQEAGIVGCLHLRFGCLFMMCSTPFVGRAVMAHSTAASNITLL
jgi:hypothetical protein